MLCFDWLTFLRVVGSCVITAAAILAVLLAIGYMAVSYMFQAAAVRGTPLLSVYSFSVLFTVSIRYHSNFASTRRCQPFCPRSSPTSPRSSCRQMGPMWRCRQRLIDQVLSRGVLRDHAPCAACRYGRAETHLRSCCRFGVGSESEEEDRRSKRKRKRAAVDTVSILELSPGSARSAGHTTSEPAAMLLDRPQIPSASITSASNQQAGSPVAAVTNGTGTVDPYGYTIGTLSHSGSVTGAATPVAARPSSALSYNSGAGSCMSV